MKSTTAQSHQHHSSPNIQLKYTIGWYNLVCYVYYHIMCKHVHKSSDYSLFFQNVIMQTLWRLCWFYR